MHYVKNVLVYVYGLQVILSFKRQIEHGSDVLF